jgi:hypothetical protein
MYSSVAMCRPITNVKTDPQHMVLVIHYQGADGLSIMAFVNTSVASVTRILPTKLLQPLHKMLEWHRTCSKLTPKRLQAAQKQLLGKDGPLS